jgi:hypothetical protein
MQHQLRTNLSLLTSRMSFKSYKQVLLTSDRALNIVKTQSPFPSACSNWPCCSCAISIEKEYMSCILQHWKRATGKSTFQTGLMYFKLCQNNKSENRFHMCTGYSAVLYYNWSLYLYCKFGLEVCSTIILW